MNNGLKIRVQLQRNKADLLLFSTSLPLLLIIVLEAMQQTQTQTQQGRLYIQVVVNEMTEKNTAMGIGSHFLYPQRNFQDC
jgi:hypothetical protein